VSRKVLECEREQCDTYMALRQCMFLDLELYHSYRGLRPHTPCLNDSHWVQKTESDVKR
jgi:hypothetical protein